MEIQNTFFISGAITSKDDHYGWNWETGKLHASEVPIIFFLSCWWPIVALRLLAVTYDVKDIYYAL